MSYPQTQRPHQPGNRLGGRPFNHGPSTDAERQYDDLRDKARQAASRAHNAYERGDGAEAHQLSEQSKQYNKQASEYIFRENNAHVASDTIDLHGQYVEEAEDIVETRIRAAQAQGQSHLHVIVGKGNHSRDHVQKIKPKVEQLCQEMGLQYHTEQNEGRIYVQLQGGEMKPPQEHYPQYYQQGQQGGSYGGGGYSGQQQQQQPQYNQQQQYGGGQQYGHPQQQMQQEDQMEQEIEKGIMKCLKGCCTVM